MISVVTVNFKTKDYIEKMLTSLFAHTHADVEVFVVENGSGDDLSDLEERFPQVRFIYNKENLGFAGGCNTAIKEAKGEFVALVNPDVIFTEDALSEIERHMREDKDVGIGGISLRNLDGTQQRCVWGFPHPLDQLLLLLKVPHILGDIGPLKRWRAADFDYGKTQNVDQVMGAFFVIRRALLDQIGMLDDGYFIWYEEVDYCRQAINAKWKVRYYADVSAKHKGGGSFDRVRTYKKQQMVRTSLRRYMRKHFGIGAWLLFTALEPVFILTGLIASIIKPQ